MGECSYAAIAALSCNASGLPSYFTPTLKVEESPGLRCASATVSASNPQHNIISQIIKRIANNS